MNKMTNEQKRLVLDNYNLVHFVMHKKFPAYYPGSYEYEDFSQQGYLGLCLAAMQYNADLSSFSTYAFNYIWGYIARYRNQKSEWAFHIRRDGKWEHIAYGSLNMITCEGDSFGESYKLMNVIPDRNCQYDVFETWVDLVPAFRKAHRMHGETILKLALAGYRQKEIASILGISKCHVSRCCTKARDIYFAVQQYNPRYPDQIVMEMFEKGYSKKLIADILDVDPAYVKRTIYNNSRKLHTPL